jgi:outer membrane lipoprotein-sorting protein
MPAWTLVTAIALALVAGQAAHPDYALLRRGDIGAFAPESFRATLALTTQSGKERHEIEVWRSGGTKTLVRMLDAKERGKFLLRLGDDMWFISPSAKKPVKLNASYRLYGGATLDEVLGVRLSEAYNIESTARQTSPAGDEQVVFNLTARQPRQLYQQVRYVLKASTARPVSTTYRVRSGKDAATVDFLEWSTGNALYARKLVIKDVLRKGAATEIEVTTLDPRPVPDDLFRLDDGAARRALESKTP